MPNITELPMRFFRVGGGMSRTFRVVSLPSVLKARPCSIDGERGAARRMMQSAAKGFAAGRAAARLAVGLAADQAPATASPRGGVHRVLRGVLPAGKLVFKYIYLSVNGCGCPLVSQGFDSFSSLCLQISAMLPGDAETLFHSMGAEAMPVRCSL